ncbi:MAG: hypothetical protein ACAH80_04365 [Alphaproteobacteria bacterium]
MYATIRQYKKLAEERKVGGDGKTYYVLQTKSGISTIPLYLPLRHFSQPPKKVEKKLGITGIGGHYKMPRRLTPHSLQAYTQVLWHAEMRGDITEETMLEKMGKVRALLEAHNPELKKLAIRPGDSFGLYDLLLGVASDFNTRDIQSWLDGNTGTVVRKDPAWQALNAQIEKTVPLFWVPTMETMREIENQIELKRRYDAQEELRRRTWGPDYY